MAPTVIQRFSSSKVTVTLRNRVGILENENGRFEANIVLLKVFRVLLLVPLKSHDSPRLGENTVLAPVCQYICMYTLRYASRAQKVEIDTTDSKAGKPATCRYGGEGGIRTHGRISPTHAFQACSLNRSDTSPHARRAVNLTNLAESRWRRTGGHHHCDRTPPPRTPNHKLPSVFFRRASPSRTSNSCCPLLNFLRLLRGRLIGRTPDFESGYRGSSPRPGANPSFKSRRGPPATMQFWPRAVYDIQQYQYFHL
jgi:hypothetical protein